MSRIHVEASRVVDASPQDVYALLADYRTRHPQILPDNFVGYRVEEGGQGAGTIVSFRVRAGGRERSYRMQVSEPEKGRVIQERDTMSSLVTTFTLDPEAGGKQTRVTIATEWEGAGGVGGFFERTFAPGAMRRIYDDELNRLAAALGGSPAAAGGDAQ